MVTNPHFSQHLLFITQHPKLVLSGAGTERSRSVEWVTFGGVASLGSGTYLALPRGDEEKNNLRAAQSAAADEGKARLRQRRKEGPDYQKKSTQYASTHLLGVPASAFSIASGLLKRHISHMAVDSDLGV
jgi:hypothetical protein